MANNPTSKTAADDKQARAGIATTAGISLDVPAIADDGRPLPVSHVSSPAYHSPLRHHRRESSRNKGVKETLNAKSHYGSSDDDGGSVHRINQYNIKQEIGRGSFGSVHLAVDQYGQEYAIKEFSKSRLRKRAQSDLLRRPSRRKRTSNLSSGGFNSPLHRHTSDDLLEQQNAFDLIRGEIAIMKKLDHPNLVALIEVLDDPDEDSLYMVMEMCKKGVVMKVGLDETADPYDDETCRYWFRDMVLGLEYLHAQGIIHRDLKPDNCLITSDDVLKIVDFGVSEMFDKESEMHTSKHAGSPAFMPPELCVPKHGNVSGRAVDIWSMGVTLYCLRYGRIPFDTPGMLELFESIRTDPVVLHDEKDERFRHLIMRMLEKDPNKRITMAEIREHPWVTKNGEDPLLSEEQNCTNIIEDPTEEEVSAAITGKLGHLMAVAKAVKRFKKLIFHKRPELMEGILGRSSRIVSPPQPLAGEYGARQFRSSDNQNRRPIETVLATEGIHHELHVTDSGRVIPARAGSQSDFGPSSKIDPISRRSTGLDQESTGTTTSSASTPPAPSGLRGRRHESARAFSPDEEGRGHAHDPLIDTLYLKIGPGPGSPPPRDDALPAVCESPPGIDEDIYEKAYEEEMERILERRGRAASIYLTRRVEHKKSLREKDGIIDKARAATTGGTASSPSVAAAAAASLASRFGGAGGPGGAGKGLMFADLVRRAKDKGKEGGEGDAQEGTGVDGEIAKGSAA